MAGRKISMNVPDVVQMASAMTATMATLGPASQSHQDTPRKPWLAIADGAEVTPRPDSTMCSTPFGSSNQLGPCAPRLPMIALITPVVPKMYRNRIDTATELVMDGK